MTNNTMLFKTLIDGYEAVAATNNYIFGYTSNHMVYVTITTGEILPYVCKLDKGSRGAGYSLRFKPTKSQKELLKLEQTFVLCSEEFFLDTVANSKYNKGEIFEKMVTEYFGQIWEKDSVPFTVQGDLLVNGIDYQIKYQSATFCSEKSLANLSK